MSAPLIPKLKGIPTIFGEVFECNVTFCLDTSGSMYKGLDVVKEHLVETLLKMASKPKPCTFNIIEFNSEVVQWADKMVKCTPETVAVAAEWINKLSAKTGTNTQDALLAALSDPGCESVYLVTDGLPDQLPQDILDEIGFAGRNRAIHCIYLCTEQSTESAAIEFLEDLAVETFGSFHIVTLTQHGMVERITPIYRADHAHERIIRTLNGTLRDSSKTCGVSTTLQVDPEESMYLAPRVSLMGGIPPVADPLGYPYWWPAWRQWFLHPYRYYYPHGWSRYRPAKGWLKAQEHLLDGVDSTGVSPAAGALLIGKQVLARRIDDGYFYLGTVQSQVLDDKFLVAFGPCKHGKYKETNYQDTFIYDIIDYVDAQRHSILTGDKVLAPWEPEGERFGPGVVIEGHEKRQAKGPDDCQITVTFTNGKTEKVPRDQAVWTPDPVYERLALELKMPKEARMSLQTTDHYPKENLPGYPTSGPKAVPDEYPPPPAFGWEHDPVFIEGRPWQFPYVPTAPMLYRKEDVTSAVTKTTVKSEDINKLIPGTSLTEKELRDKVTSQLVEHKLVLDEQQTEKESQLEKEIQAERERERKRWEEERRKRWEEQERRRWEEEEIRRRQEEVRRRQEEERIKEEQVTEDKAANEVEMKEREAKLKEAETLRQRKEQLEKDIEEERILLLEKEREKHRLRLEEIEREIHRRERQHYCEKSGQSNEVSQKNDQSESRLLRKREKQEENLLKKSVSFRDEVQEGETEKERDELVDSGVHVSDEEEKYKEEFNFDKFSQDRYERAPRRMDADYRYLYRRETSPQPRDQARPPWRKYWTTDSIPEIIQPVNHGPYRETALQAPLEARDMRGHPFACEWTGPVYRYVDPYAKHNYNSSVEMLMKTPQPPPAQKQAFVDVRGIRPSSAMTKEEARREYRRQRVAARNREWNKRLCKEDMMKELMQDQHRERIMAQLERDQQRLMKEQQTIDHAREAKKQISAELRAKMEKQELKNQERERKRIEAMRERREQREAAMAQKQREEEQIADRRKEVKMQRSQQRWDSVHQRLEQEEKENQQHADKVLQAKVNRAEHFRKLEEDGQAKKDLRIKVTDQHIAMYRSQVLP